MSRTLFRTILQDHREHMAATPEQHAHLRHLARCRTAEAGCHARRCLACDHQDWRFNSCRNRHCPLCQSAEQAAWVEARESELLPVPYFHIVCTLPHDLLPLVRHAPALLYGLLMQCSRQAVAELCADPKHLGAQVGQVQVLHTWGSDLKLHPHVHSLVTGGGLAADGSWVDCRYNRKNKRPFLVPMRCMQQRFRGLMMQALHAAFAQGQFADCAHPGVGSRAAWRGWMRGINAKRWVVYAKRPFARPELVVRYIGRYTHRVALDPSRLSGYDGQSVTLRWTDYRAGGRQRFRRMPASDLIGRFLQHLLPKYFRRIRLSGLWGPRVRHANLERARAALRTRQPRAAAHPPPPPAGEPVAVTPPAAGHLHAEADRCPRCRRRSMLVVSVIRPLRGGGVMRIIPQAFERAQRHLRPMQV
jgi:hypothetical protein